jgi:N-methylhydantoinase A
MKRIAVDIGGTFTDIVYIDDDTMQMATDKVRSTPWEIGQAVIDVVKKINVDMSGVELFIHGTTAGLNTIAQQKGARVGLLTTRGFTDVLEMARGDKKEVYNSMWKKPKPLVPRNLRFPVSERMSYLGEVLEALDEKGIRTIARKMREDGVEAVAVCLLHAYANPDHERRIGEIIGEVWPEISVSLSHRVARQIREYERMSSTVINAYVGKTVGGYLSRLGGSLMDMGFTGQLLVLGPSGLIGLDAFRDSLLYTLASGTVGGAAGAAYLAGHCGVKDVVTMDVGGTSFDVSIIKDGQNLEIHKAEIMGYPLMIAGIEVRSIGAGGGSIARVDEAGLLTVGPESAGADPGPMAYGLGGTEPTVTDAALINGLIDPDYFLGGETRLDLELARKGVSSIAERLKLDLYQAADGILAIARNNMTTATTKILIGQGYDPRDFTIMAFGGGGGIFAGNIAKDMSISRVIIPPGPGVFCARGILTMNLVHTYARAHMRSLDTLDVRELENVFGEMENSARRTLAAEGMPPDKMEFVRSLDMGYEGQHHYVETPVTGGKMEEGVKKIIGEAFESLHEARYGHRIEAPMVTINARLKAIGRIKEVPETEIGRGKEIPSGAIKPSRQVYLDGGFRETLIYERDGLLGGKTIVGPAIVEEPFHTTVVMPGQTLQVDKLGNLIINTGGA